VCGLTAALLLWAAAAQRADARTVVRIPDAAVVYATPGGPPLTAGGAPVTEHGSAWVVHRHGIWLAIPTILRHGRGLGWIRRTPARRLTSTRLLVRVDLSQRRMWVTRGGRPLMTAPVAIGAPSSPSPTGPTSVSARIATGAASGLSPRGYGPVVVALRLWQPAASPGFPGGGVMAFHGGRGAAAGTSGCFRMADAAAVRLARVVRAGTPVIIGR
jgi:lipoprotein-anchoring transpeptidase ErfK/SrfK